MAMDIIIHFIGQPERLPVKVRGRDAWVSISIEWGPPIGVQKGPFM